MDCANLSANLFLATTDEKAGHAQHQTRQRVTKSEPQKLRPTAHGSSRLPIPRVIGNSLSDNKLRRQEISLFEASRQARARRRDFAEWPRLAKSTPNDCRCYPLYQNPEPKAKDEILKDQDCPVNIKVEGCRHRHENRCHGKKGHDDTLPKFASDLK